MVFVTLACSSDDDNSTTGSSNYSSVAPTAVSVGSYSPQSCTQADLEMERMYVKNVSDSAIIDMLVDSGMSRQQARQKYEEFQSGIYCVMK